MPVFHSICFERHHFTSKDVFFILQPANGVITQVSGSHATVEGIGIVLNRVPQTDVIIPLYPCYSSTRPVLILGVRPTGLKNICVFHGEKRE